MNKVKQHHYKVSCRVEDLPPDMLEVSVFSDEVLTTEEILKAVTKDAVEAGAEEILWTARDWSRGWISQSLHRVEEAIKDPSLVNEDAYSSAIRVYEA